MHGRADRRVKILGELVDVQALEGELRALLEKGEGPFQDLLPEDMVLNRS